MQKDIKICDWGREATAFVVSIHKFDEIFWLRQKRLLKLLQFQTENEITKHEMISARVCELCES